MNTDPKVSNTTAATAQKLKKKAVEKLKQCLNESSNDQSYRKTKVKTVTKLKQCLVKSSKDRVDRKPRKRVLKKLKCSVDKSNEISSVVQASDIAESCYELLSSVCLCAAQFQKHCHHEKLTVTDIQKASQSYLCGNQLNQDDRENVIDLESYIEKEDKYKESEKLFYCAKCLNDPSSDFLKDSVIHQSLMDYFMFTMKAVFRNNHEILTFSLSDLKKNPCILPLVPVYIQNICNDAMLLNYPPTQLRKFLQVVRSLYLNPNLYFRNEYLYQILNFVISCATSNLSSQSFPPDDSYSFQNAAAEFLSEILTEDYARSRALYKYAVSKLELPFKAPKLRYCSCYGAIVSLIAIGLPAVAYVIPSVFITFSKKLQESLNMCIQEDAIRVREKLLDACQLLLRQYLRAAVTSFEASLGQKVYLSDDGKEFHCEDTDSVPLNVELCINSLKYFGDSLSSRLPSLTSDSGEAVSPQKFFEMVHLKENSYDQK